VGLQIICHDYPYSVAGCKSQPPAFTTIRFAHAAQFMLGERFGTVYVGMCFVRARDSPSVLDNTQKYED
jgi:hypothetical protein